MVSSKLTTELLLSIPVDKLTYGSNRLLLSMSKTWLVYF